VILPLVAFDQIDLAAANGCLVEWGHKMGPLERGNESGKHFALFENGRPVAVTMQSSLIRECVGGGQKSLTRANTCELSRLCAERPHLCRVALRLWREFVFPLLGYDHVISYQDADLHNGNTYRFDGWQRIAYSHSGTDARSGRKGRDKWIWAWSAKGAEPLTPIGRAAAAAGDAE
jgi:hypothetical protein